MLHDDIVPVDVYVNQNNITDGMRLLFCDQYPEEVDYIDDATKNYEGLSGIFTYDDFISKYGTPLTEFL